VYVVVISTSLLYRVDCVDVRFLSCAIGLAELVFLCILCISGVFFVQ
jgi:hypothetical protein